MFRAGKIAQARRGFTLLELLVVVIIIAGVAALVAPRLWDFGKKAKKEVNKYNLKKIQDVMDSHYENTGKLPDGLDLLNDTTVTMPATMAVPLSEIDLSTAGITDLKTLNDMGLVNVFKGDPFDKNEPLALSDKVYQVDPSQEVWRFVGGMNQDISGCIVFGVGEHIVPYSGDDDMLVTLQNSGTYQGLPAGVYKHFMVLLRVQGGVPYYAGCIDPLVQGTTGD